jgi:hypothetical protein
MSVTTLSGPALAAVPVEGDQAARGSPRMSSRTRRKARSGAQHVVRPSSSLVPLARFQDDLRPWRVVPKFIDRRNGEFGRSAQRRCDGLRAPRFSQFDLPSPPVTALPASRASGRETWKCGQSTTAKATRAHGAVANLDIMGHHQMAMTATERSRVLRERRACGKVVLTIVVGEYELAEIARAGYAEAASTDRKARTGAASLEPPVRPPRTLGGRLVVDN